MIEIEAMDGPDRGQHWSTRKATIQIGRSKTADVRVSAPTVSELHTTIRFDSGWYELSPTPRDKGQVWINQDSSAVNRPQRLVEGDVLRLGGPQGPALRVHFVYDREEWARQQASPPEPIPRELLAVALVMLLTFCGVVIGLITAL
jgi:predicted component of type VI protein secretion system